MSPPFILLSQGYEIIHYNAKGGLMDNFVWNIEQDACGKIYACTNLGISVLDGKKIRNTRYPLTVSPVLNQTIYTNSDNGVAVKIPHGFLEFRNNTFVTKEYPSMHFWVANFKSNSIHSNSNHIKDGIGGIYFNSTKLIFNSGGKEQILDTNIFYGTGYQIFQDQQNNVYAKTKNRLYQIKNGQIIKSVSSRLSEAEIILSFYYEEMLFLCLKTNENNWGFYLWDFNKNELSQVGKTENEPLNFFHSGKEILLLTNKNLIAWNINVKNKNRTINHKEEIINGLVNEGKLSYISKDFHYVQIDISNEKIISRNYLSPLKSVYKFKIDPEGNIWAATDAGLFQFKPSVWQNKVISEPSKEKIKILWKNNDDITFLVESSKGQTTLFAEGLNDKLTIKSTGENKFPWFKPYSNIEQSIFQFYPSYDKNISTFKEFYFHSKNGFKPAITKVDLNYIENGVTESNSKHPNKSKVDLAKIPLVFSLKPFIKYQNKLFNRNAVGPYCLKEDNSVKQFVFDPSHITSDIYHQENTYLVTDYNLNHFSWLFLFHNKLYYNNLSELYCYNTIKDSFEQRINLYPIIKKNKLTNNGAQFYIYPLDAERYVYFDTIREYTRFLKFINVNQKIELIPFKRISEFSELTIENTFLFRDTIYLHTNVGFFKLKHNNGKFSIEKFNTSNYGAPYYVHNEGNRMVIFYEEGLSFLDENGKIYDFLYDKNFIGNIAFNSHGGYPNFYFDQSGHFNFFTNYQWVRLNHKTNTNFKIKRNLYVENFKLLNSNGSSISISLDSITNKVIKIPYGAPLEIELGYAYFNNPDSIKFKIKLDGFDDDFYIQKEAKVSYKQLAPGSYKMLAYVYNDNSGWSDNPLQINFEIPAPWYLSKMAYTLYLLCGFSGLYGLIRLNTRRLRKNAERLSVEVEKATEKITQQKELIEERQKEIVDSINYAERIQRAMLPSHDKINHFFTDSFVLFKPKDVVSGDFYWADQLNNFFFVAACDCTGHGVPGAIVSVVCNNALNRAIKEFHLTDTGKILDKTRELVIETFAKSSAEIKDGMDVSLLAIDQSAKKVFWSGANNPLWYIQGNELIEIKANKQPIGKMDNAKPFDTHEINVSPGTVFYLFTDGLADQFGGPKGKKFKYKQLQDILISINNDSLPHQADFILKRFNEWKGSLEQVDDVCLLGLRL
ncbi:MAG: SpoIIE family protein phosphatase [Bacteroidota bacterium]